MLSYPGIGSQYFRSLSWVAVAVAFASLAATTCKVAMRIASSSELDTDTWAGPVRRHY